MRKLREDGGTSTLDVRPTVREDFDFDMLDDMKPYLTSEELPPAVTKVNRKGVAFLEKSGEPRFYFNGNEYIKVWNGLGGKKTKLHWTYKGDCNVPVKTSTSNDIRPLHRKIRSYLRQKGIPGA